MPTQEQISKELLDAMKKAGVKSEDLWDTREEAPFVSGRRFDKEGNEYIFLNDRVYTGKAQEKTGEQKKGGAANFFVGFILCALLVFPTLIYGLDVMRGIIQEKKPFRPSLKPRADPLDDLLL